MLGTWHDWLWCLGGFAAGILTVAAFALGAELRHNRPDPSIREHMKR